MQWRRQRLALDATFDSATADAMQSWVGATAPESCVPPQQAQQPGTCLQEVSALSNCAAVTPLQVSKAPQAGILDSVWWRAVLQGSEYPDSVHMTNFTEDVPLGVSEEGGKMAATLWCAIFVLLFRLAPL